MLSHLKGETHFPQIYHVLSMQMAFSLTNLILAKIPFSHNEITLPYMNSLCKRYELVQTKEF